MLRSGGRPSAAANRQRTEWETMPFTASGVQTPVRALRSLGFRLRSAVGHTGFTKFIVLSRSRTGRSAAHTSELQSLMRISYAVFCLYIIHFSFLLSLFLLTSFFFFFIFSL